MITAVITTSPIPAHPDIGLIAECLDAIRWHLPHVPVLVLADGVHPEETFLFEQYQEYKKRLVEFMNGKNVKIKEFDSWQHQSGMLARALKEKWIKTSLIFWCDHDIVMRRRIIEWDGLARSLEAHQLDGVRFHLGIPLESSEKRIETFCVTPIYRTQQFLGWPQLVRLEFFQALVDLLGPDARTYLGGVSETDCMAQNFVHGVWAPEGDGVACDHRDGHGYAAGIRTGSVKPYIEIRGQRYYTDSVPPERMLPAPPGKRRLAPWINVFVDENT